MCKSFSEMETGLSRPVPQSPRYRAVGRDRRVWYQRLWRIIGAMAEFERGLIVERVKAGMRNARAKGRRIGRPAHVLLMGQLREEIAEAYQQGEDSLRAIAARFGTSLGTVQRCVAPYAKHRSPSPEPANSRRSSIYRVESASDSKCNFLP